MKHYRLFLFLAVFVITSLACSLFGGAGSTGVGGSPSAPGDSGGAGAEESSPAPDSAGDYDTEFPLPTDVQNFMNMGDDDINYQTSLSIPEVVDFYREAFAAEGYEEREITTVINDTTFSIVWDGHPNGRALVVQGVDLGNGTTNVNVRFEDV
jgi:hypothetical protein